MHQAEHWKDGLSFLTDTEAALQVGTWRYPADKVLRSHRHRVYSRSVDQTQETIFIVSGSLAVEIFGLSNQKIEELELHAGDFIVLLDGGHGYRILEDDTRVFEVKNGPFLSAEVDKEMIL